VPHDRENRPAAYRTNSTGGAVHRRAGPVFSWSCFSSWRTRGAARGVRPVARQQQLALRGAGPGPAAATGVHLGDNEGTAAARHLLPVNAYCRCENILLLFMTTYYYDVIIFSRFSRHLSRIPIQSAA